MMSGDVVAVTGGASGIGAAVTRRVAARGASPVILDVDEEGARHLIESLPAGSKGRFIHTDISDPGSVAAAAEQLSHWSDKLNGLVACAGLLVTGSADSYSLEDWDRTFAVNVRGVWLAVKETYPLLREAAGCVVAVVSVHAVATRPGYAAYASSKAAVTGLVKGMATDFAPDGVRVLGVSPSGVLTPLTDRAAERLGREKFAAMVAGYPFGRLAEASEIAEVIDFLLYDASYMTGTVVTVDGGVLAHL